MNQIIAKAKTASVEQLMEMALLLNDAAGSVASAARMAVMVALEGKLAANEFKAFCDELDAMEAA